MSPAATRDEVLQAYAARLSEAGADETRRDAVTEARDALLAATAWLPPGSPAPSMSQPPTTAPQQPPTSAMPGAQYTAPSGGPYPGYPQPGYPQPGQPQGVPGPWYPGPPPRRRLSTGAIVGITVGGIAAGLVILLVAVFAIASISDSGRRLAEAGSRSSAPFAPPSDTPSATPSDGSTDPATDDYDVDGVHVHYVDGWTFELTPSRSCVGATITAGFADSVDGDTVDEWTVTADLQAGVPYELTIPDSASTHQYVGIDSVDCTQT